MDVMSGIGSFKVVLLDPAHTLVQADGELSLVNLTATQKLWKVDLRASKNLTACRKRPPPIPSSRLTHQSFTIRYRFWK